MKNDFRQFFKHVRIWYLLFSSLLIIAFIFGSFEIINRVLFSGASTESMRWLYFSRGITVALLLMVWAAWTVYSYRELYQEQVEVTEGYYRDIVTHSADAIVSLQVDGTIISWNKGAQKMLGWKHDEIVGKSVKKIIPQQLLNDGELEYLKHGMYEEGEVTNYETKRLHKNGDEVVVSLSESIIRNKDDKIIGRSKILRDLTDVKIKEEQAQHSERLATLGHMAAGVAHEVGNPLTAISSIVQVCQRKTDDTFLQERLKKVRNHIQRINKIVHDLVDFARPSSLEKERMQINTIIESAVGLLRHDSRCRDVTFNMDLSTSLPSVEGVPDQIHQVIVNILLNAVDAMQDVGDPVVNINTCRKDSVAEISIRDIGKGIPADIRNQIFEPFFTTKEVGSGTGLGLSVSHGIVKQMEGQIDVESELGAGTTFTILLPIQKKQTDQKV